MASNSFEISRRRASPTQLLHPASTAHSISINSAAKPGSLNKQPEQLGTEGINRSSVSVNGLRKQIERDHGGVRVNLSWLAAALLLIETWQPLLKMVGPE